MFYSHICDIDGIFELFVNQQNKDVYLRVVC